MAEVEKYVFDYKEIVTQMIKAEDIHEGTWALYVEFGITAANISMHLATEGSKRPEGPPTELTPAAIIPIQKIGITKTDVETNLSVDAAKVNPKAK